MRSSYIHGSWFEDKRNRYSKVSINNADYIYVYVHEHTYIQLVMENPYLERFKRAIALLTRVR